MVEMRGVELISQRAEVEYRAQRLKAETWDPHAKVKLRTGRPEADSHNRV